MQIKFREKNINAIKLYKQYKNTPRSIFTDEYNNLSKDERSLLLAIVSEEELETIADGIYVAAKTNAIEIKKVIEIALQGAGYEHAETFIPLFFSHDVSNSKSDYITNKEIRDKAFKIFSDLIETQGLNISKLKQDFREYHYNTFCFYSVKKDFQKICERYDLEKRFLYEQAKNQVRKENNIKIFGLFMGLLLGLFFGPLAYLHVNLDSGSVKSAKEEYEDEIARPFMNAGVTLMTVTYIVLIYTSF